MFLLALFAIGIISAIAALACDGTPFVHTRPHDGGSFARAQLRRRPRTEGPSAGYSLEVC